MPEARRRELDAMLRGLTPKHQRQLSVSTSNALDRFAVIEAVLSHRKLVLLLDYDGTLTPIVNDPSKAVLSERVRAILRELPKHFITGVISGRALGKIRAFVDVPGLFYAGSHGFDILAPSQPSSLGSKSRSSSPAPPDHASREEASAIKALEDDTISSEVPFSVPHTCNCGRNNGKNGTKGGDTADTPPPPPTEEGVLIMEAESNGVGGAGVAETLEEVRHQVAAEYLPVMAKIREELISELKGIERSEVEDNRFSISIHYRNCARADVPKVRDVVREVQSRHERIRMGSGKEVFELQPDIAWDKGKAVLWLLDKLVMPMADEAISTSIATSTVVPNTALANEKDEKIEISTIVRRNSYDRKRTLSVDDSGARAGASGSGSLDASGHEDEDGGFFTIFIGDDKTDENAFRVFTGEQTPGGHDGLGILVSEESRETNAAYTLRNPNEVALFLEKIAQFGSQCCSARR